MSDKIELLPCPFCGGEARVIAGLAGCEVCAIGRRDAESWNRRAALAQQPAPDQELREQIKRLKADRSACWAEFKVMSRSVRECERERNELKERLDTALEFLRHVKKCLCKNGEYAPLSHEELDLIIGIHPLAQAALTNKKGEV